MVAPSKVVLPSNVPITDKNGNPSPFFARQLKALLDEKADIAVIADAAQATADAAIPADALLAQLVSDLGGDPNADRILFWDDSEGTFKFLTAGSGLTITTDTMTASGSSGNSCCFPVGIFTTNDAGSFATLGNVLIPAETFTIDQLYGSFDNASIGNVYSMFIATINSSGTITGTLATASNPFTTIATGKQQVTFTLASPATLTAGTSYLIALVITSGTGTSPCRPLGPATTAPWVNFPIDLGKMDLVYATTSKRYWYSQNSASPTSVAPTSSSSGLYGLGFRAQF